jgi:hypothetical protein
LTIGKTSTVSEWTNCAQLLDGAGAFLFPALEVQHLLLVEHGGAGPMVTEPHQVPLEALEPQEFDGGRLRRHGQITLTEPGDLFRVLVDEMCTCEQTEMEAVPRALQPRLRRQSAFGLPAVLTGNAAAFFDGEGHGAISRLTFGLLRDLVKIEALY